MRNNRVINLVVGLFVLAGLLGLVFLGLKASNMSGFKAGETYEVNAYFIDVSGLNTNASVTMAGVQIGRVKSIKLDQERFQAKVVLEISKRYDNLPLDTSADILTAGLLGEKYIGLVGGGDVVMLTDGDTIQYTGSAFVLEKLIQQFLSQMSMKDS